MKRIPIRNIVFSFFIVILALAIIGMTKIRSYNYYEVPELNMELLNDEESYQLVNTYVSYDAFCACTFTTDYYKMTTSIPDYDFYTILVTVEIDQNEDNSTQVTGQYESIKRVIIKSDLSSEDTGYQLANYMTTDYSKQKRGLDISISFNNLLGKKEISSSSNRIGYVHSGSNTPQGIYQGEFSYQDYTADSTVQTMFTVQVPIGEPLNISFDYKIEMNASQVYPFSIEHTETTGDWTKVEMTIEN